MRRVLTGEVLLIFLLAAGASAAEPVRVTLALSGGRVIDGYEGKPIEDAVVLIDRDRIAPVRPGSEILAPPGTLTIDTRGTSVLPGQGETNRPLMVLGHG